MSLLVTFVRVLRMCIVYIFVPVATPIYLIFLYMVSKYRTHHQFSSTFFTLIMSCGVADLLYMAHYMLMFRVGSEGFLIDLFLRAGNPLSTFGTVGHMFWQEAQTIGVLIMSSNRFTALVMPTRHEIMWTRSKTRKAIAAQYGLSLFLTAPQLVKCEYKYVLRYNSSVGVELADGSDSGLCALLSYGMLTVVCGLSAVVLVCLYGCMFYKAWKHAHKVAPLNRDLARERRMRRAQTNLAVGGAVISSTLLLIALHKFVGLFPGTVSPFLYYPLGAIVTNLYSLINPFALLASCPKIRGYFVLTVKGLVGIKTTPQDLAKLNRPIGATGTRSRFVKRSMHAESKM